MTRFVVIGGGVAATEAAETIRARRPDDAITLIAEEKRPFYLRPLLADFVAARVQEGDLWRDFEAVAEEKRITLLLGQPVVGVERPEGSVVLADGSTVTYDVLLVATGVQPRMPDIPGTDLDGVTPFSTYADAVNAAAWAKRAKRAVVIGRGLQGVELTRALRLRGLQVTMVVPDESPWFPALFQVKGQLIEEALKQYGVEVIALDEAVELLGSEGSVRAVRTRKGRELPAEVVGFALDQRASTGLLVGSGISLAEGVVVDARLRSTDEQVYAAGDVAQLERDGKRRPIGYGWMRARAHGEAAGRNMTGDEVLVEAGDETEAQALYGQSLVARWR